MPSVTIWSASILWKALDQTEVLKRGGSSVAVMTTDPSPWLVTVTVCRKSGASTGSEVEVFLLNSTPDRSGPA
jgi:hypothetical protein